MMFILLRLLPPKGGSHMMFILLRLLPPKGGSHMMFILLRLLPPKGGSHMLLILLFNLTVASAFRRKDKLIGKGPQLPLRHQRRIEIPHGPGRRVSGILKQRLPFPFAFLIHADERSTRQIHLAPNLDASGRRTTQGQRDRA